jgi:hypothetical protein
VLVTHPDKAANGSDGEFKALQLAWEVPPCDHIPALNMPAALLFGPSSPQGSAQGFHRQVLRDPVRRAAYDRRAAVTQLHAGGAIAEELDLDDFACSVTDRWLQNMSLFTLRAARSYHCNTFCVLAAVASRCLSFVASTAII